jgi:hypothetical protein
LIQKSNRRRVPPIIRRRFTISSEVNTSRSDQCCLRFWRLEPFCPAGAVAGVVAGWGWGCTGALATGAAALQSQPVAAPVGALVAMGGTIADSLILLCFCLLALIESSQKGFSQEACQPDLRANMQGKPLSCNRMQRADQTACRLR